MDRKLLVTLAGQYLSISMLLKSPNVTTPIILWYDTVLAPCRMRQHTRNRTNVDTPNERPLEIRTWQRLTNGSNCSQLMITRIL